MASVAYRIIVTAAEDFLKESGSFGQSNCKNYREVVSAVRSKIRDGVLNIEATDGTILSYISSAANNDENSGIVSGGSGGGYWYESPKNTSAVDSEPDQEEVSQAKGKSVTVYEKDLYPLLELWLEGKGYTSKDIANLKKGGRWGNPDIIGIDRIELFGAVEVEVASCEVKLAADNWEQVIFEAISHKRFANRSWFCYRTSQEGAPLPKGMEYYAERYRVGVVQIILENDELLKLKGESKLPSDYLGRVVERVPAPYDYVPLREKRDLVDRTGISMSFKF